MSTPSRTFSLGRYRLTGADLLLAATLLLLLPVLLWLSFDFGITWDEHFHVTYGRMVADFYASGFQDRSALNYLSLYLYGGFFDLLCHLATRALPAMQQYDVRHLVNSLFGWLAIASTALLARRLFGPLTGLCAVIFLLLSPRFVAECMNNPKDLPFAALFCATLCAFSYCRPTFPYFRPRTAIVAMLATALTINIRVGGLLLIGYAGLLLLVLALRKASDRSWRRLSLLGAGYILASLLTIAMGTLFWPWALQNPLLRPLQALGELSRFPLVFSELFAGQFIPTPQLPWYYLLVWLGVTLPLGVLIFGLAGMTLLPFPRERRAPAAALAFASLFPLLYILVRQPMLYNGARHLLFIYPPFVALAAGALTQLFTRLWGKRLAMAALMVLLIGGFYDPLRFHLRNHPNQIVYFNQLVGGVSGAYLRYELDYWGNSYKQAVDRLREQARSSGSMLRFSAGMAGHVAEEYARRFPELEYISNGGDTPYRLDLVLGGPEILQLVKKDDIADTVQVDGIPICLIRKHP